MKHAIDALLELAVRVLLAANTGERNARCVAAALLAAEADGIASHGLARLPYYADQALSGKVDGNATPRLQSADDGAVTVDAGFGFAFPALELARDALLVRAPQHGIAACAVRRSHHAGVLAHAIEALADAGLVALAFSNTPAAMAPWGGALPAFGTNPLAFAAPCEGAAPLLVDLSLSQAARGKIVAAAQRGERIPEDWALDAQGRPTSDPRAALDGSMQPLGGSKGAALALVVELLSAALSGSNFAFQASSFFTASGAAPGTGQLVLAMDPRKFGDGGFAAHAATLCRFIEAQAGTRLPGRRRLAAREAARRDGIEVAGELFEALRERAG